MTHKSLRCTRWVLTPVEVMMQKEQLTELADHLQKAAEALRDAWMLCKHNGMEPTAKEIAGTVLDVETTRDRVTDLLWSNA
jgi:hypothetical protein